MKKCALALLVLGLFAQAQEPAGIREAAVVRT
jgi:hypothetical protein